MEKVSILPRHVLKFPQINISKYLQITRTIVETTLAVNARVHVLSRARAFTALARVHVHGSLQKKDWLSPSIL